MRQNQLESFKAYPFDCLSIPCCQTVISLCSYVVQLYLKTLCNPTRKFSKIFAYLKVYLGFLSFLFHNNHKRITKMIKGKFQKSQEIQGLATSISKNPSKDQFPQKQRSDTEIVRISPPISQIIRNFSSLLAIGNFLFTWPFLFVFDLIIHLCIHSFKYYFLLSVDISMNFSSLIEKYLPKPNNENSAMLGSQQLMQQLLMVSFF